jgi:hypothetical protein
VLPTSALPRDGNIERHPSSYRLLREILSVVESVTFRCDEQHLLAASDVPQVRGEQQKRPCEALAPLTAHVLNEALPATKTSTLLSGRRLSFPQRVPTGNQ